MAASATHLINESQKEQELQRRHQQEQILQQQQKLQELQGQINAQYSSVVNTPQSLMFFPLLEHLRGLQQPATLPPGVPKSPIPNHLLPPHQVTNWLATAHLAQIVEKHSPPRERSQSPPPHPTDPDAPLNLTKPKSSSSGSAGSSPHTIPMSLQNPAEQPVAATVPKIFQFGIGGFKSTHYTHEPAKSRRTTGSRHRSQTDAADDDAEGLPSLCWRCAATV
ncbi:hypothetical protein QE152_g8922 [Popillia japonica]|uniref:Uncharacterized protein n=1 Tax=Popillia japonica TaxID=7064 RepID=A0AAW1M195_POPJA